MDLGQIDLEIEKQDFFNNETLLSQTKEIKIRGVALHLMSLMVACMATSITYWHRRSCLTYNIPITLYLITDEVVMLRRFGGRENLLVYTPYLSTNVEVGTVIGVIMQWIVTIDGPQS